MCLRKQLANAVRILSIDAVQQANSGHPGAPMGMADVAEVLWRSFLKHNPCNPYWDNRDRFVLSNGHASMLLYSVLHLTGYDITIDDIKDFRQLYSKTPGHPELEYTPGVEITTGPLGQGLASAVGMAIAERILSAYFNRINYNIVDHYTWVFVGDGCLMEGISHEVCSLAGSLKLGKLIVFYDNNGISIDGNICDWFNDDTAQRFKAYNWHVLDSINGHDADAIFNAIYIAQQVSDKPSIIICNTIIGFGSPNKSGTANAHGSPLGVEEINLSRQKLQWKYPPFYIPDDIYRQWDARDKGKKLEKEWNMLFNNYKTHYPNLADEYMRRMSGMLPIDWSTQINNFIQKIQDSHFNIATRQSSQNILEYLGKLLPELLGGSADLTPSNLTKWSGSYSIKNTQSGNYIHYGVREFGMTAIANGISNHGGFIPYTSTFLVFSDYAKNAIRMAALMKTRHVLIYTHDSIGLGEDGPTHQPIEQLSSLRSIPNMSVWRPSDTLETVIAWKYAIERYKGPTALILSRQNLLTLKRTLKQVKDVSRGGYILRDSKKKIDIILISTGSEVELTLLSAEQIEKIGYGVRVVSMPSVDIFESQERAYREFVLPNSVFCRIAVEAGKSDYWYKYVGLYGCVIGIDVFGESAPSEKLFKVFGFTIDNIVTKAKKLLSKRLK
ncbi:transketolase [Buchnera aphidicola]|uniref:Transketolase n=1 Tax=Buchnera aphidicola (Stegophylla sp.) TaxID=2315800 RepID=A0A4D6YE21_9GAMM|nr:transketolase [Buchnera aphidicola (Stegophylla sp.)]QCI26253.1 transketolase [Buchnera aphidicola (Stegophylla sp.)]